MSLSPFSAAPCALMVGDAGGEVIVAVDLVPLLLLSFWWAAARAPLAARSSTESIHAETFMAKMSVRR